MKRLLAILALLAAPAAAQPPAVEIAKAAILPAGRVKKTGGDSWAIRDPDRLPAVNVRPTAAGCTAHRGTETATIRETPRRVEIRMEDGSRAVAVRRASDWQLTLPNGKTRIVTDAGRSYTLP